MTALKFAAPDAPAIPLQVLTKAEFKEWREGLDDRAGSWIDASGFDGSAADVVTVPASDGSVEAAAVGLGTAQDAARRRFTLGAARAKLPAGTYRLVTGLPKEALDEAALGWLLAGYRFDRYKASRPPRAELVPPEGVDVRRLEAIAAGEALTRDLINTPASDMGPAELQEAAAALADEFGATIDVIMGDDLLSANLPMIHAVGRASARAPRLIDLRWGDVGAPKLTLVGKGVCFDSGGLNLKPAGGMALMKKDMGGAANALALARMIIEARLPVALRVLIPAVENAVSGASFRPGDILTSRKGLTVEIGNTDAEGRLVLADAMTYGAEDDPDLMITLATLTGAARVALGPDLPPFYCDDEAFAGEVLAAAERVADPIWRMPLWTGYEAMLASTVADLNNAPGGPFAGSILAGLFLRRFAPTRGVWGHFDIFAWRPKAAPGRPLGGEAQAIRALFDAFERRFA